MCKLCCSCRKFKLRVKLGVPSRLRGLSHPDTQTILFQTSPRWPLPLITEPLP